MPRCSAIRSDGDACRAWAVRGTDPPLCAAHKKQAEKVELALIEPPRDIDDVLKGLARKQAELELKIARLEPDADSKEVARLFNLYARNAGLLGKLLRDRRILTGERTEGLADALGAVLDELNDIWPVEI